MPFAHSRGRTTYESKDKNTRKSANWTRTRDCRASWLILRRSSARSSAGAVFARRGFRSCSVLRISSAKRRSEYVAYSDWTLLYLFTPVGSGGSCTGGGGGRGGVLKKFPIVYLLRKKPTHGSGCTCSEDQRSAQLCASLYSRQATSSRVEEQIRHRC